jgi:hypothetical protein
VITFDEKRKQEKKKKIEENRNILAAVAVSELPLAQPMDHCLDTICCRLFLCTQAALFRSCHVDHRFCISPKKRLNHKDKVLHMIESQRRCPPQDPTAKEKPPQD